MKIFTPIFTIFTFLSITSSANDLPKNCTLSLPYVEENACEGENCGKLDKFAQKDFVVYEKPDLKSKTLFTLQKGSKLDEVPNVLVAITKPGILRVYKKLSAAKKKDNSKSTLYYYLRYIELGDYLACEGSKTFSVGDERESMTDIVQKAENREWYKIKYKGKTGYVANPGDCSSGLDCFGLESNES